ncbi:hypothetical protein F2P81_015164 [Scophthalmus maximus]|uniref:Uncharacterized protein n=1 Tax=Scophthalmus maximus TaxID=52904 RepID=A0A6A4SP95_SCOMX|nr:hypothetical protein F2P81_015164 [Scophthalmus maximus]
MVTEQRHPSGMRFALHALFVYWHGSLIHWCFVDLSVFKEELLLLLVMEQQSQDTAGGAQSVKEEEEETLADEAAPGSEEEDDESLPHSEVLDIFEEGLARLVQDPLLCDLPIQVTLEEVNSQIALEYGQAMTVRVLKADGEIMLLSGFIMTSPDSDLSNTSTKLKDVSLASQQLLERKKFQCVFQELKKRVEFGRTEEAASNQHKSDAIDDKLEQRSERQAELQKSHDTVLRDSEKKTSIKSESQFPCGRSLLRHTSKGDSGCGKPPTVSVQDTVPRVSSVHHDGDFQLHQQCHLAVVFHNSGDRMHGWLLPPSLLHRSVQIHHSQVSKVSHVDYNHQTALREKNEGDTGHHLMRKLYFISLVLIDFCM